MYVFGEGCYFNEVSSCNLAANVRASRRRGKTSEMNGLVATDGSNEEKKGWRGRERGYGDSKDTLATGSGWLADQESEEGRGGWKGKQSRRKREGRNDPLYTVT